MILCSRPAFTNSEKAAVTPPCRTTPIGRPSHSGFKYRETPPHQQHLADFPPRPIRFLPIPALPSNRKAISVTDSILSTQQFTVISAPPIGATTTGAAACAATRYPSRTRSPTRAVQTIQQILTDPKPPEPKKRTEFEIQKVVVQDAPARKAPGNAQRCTIGISPKMLNSAQFAQSATAIPRRT